jgi:DNA invertase Pin-like site-specific DNA recombinase
MSMTKTPTRKRTAERMRDKVAASKRKGLRKGGLVPLGYDAAGRTLTVNHDEAASVRTLFDLYLEHQCLRTVGPRPICAAWSRIAGSLLTAGPVAACRSAGEPSTIS